MARSPEAMQKGGTSRATPLTPPIIAMRPIRAHWCTATRPAEDGVVVDADVPGERGAVGHDHVVADRAVVRDVGVGHEEAVAADARQPAALDRAAVDR